MKLQIKHQSRIVGENDNLQAEVKRLMELLDQEKAEVDALKNKQVILCFGRSFHGVKS